ncbi:pyridoxamine 5'-phosphate oxidase family protein [Glaesserella parasuis]|uniref:pyridoxamine 5'-phosphate oxidase family protein n=1 Tax=Glaesserella parasuis TaxID=738 RepID=UPI002436C9AD|nr:pyridoxamine 5'-phosphate oxidase family protein [Glaesserella parasuis]MDG6480338.1 pyridoxamine 5'-phosphate oxidase family protein [Glaesserella parasuis]MDG6857570.1 pyridoxamine 5'-phosphate oxidase family protein [Glaesserella parasuis]MDO9656224.1 pyridoxamine 5'-phosphate oxidase family protein [Glaesserella parasuis]MDO9658529.1 pyridoxamine 5'-phosphate oxidase family protein [Glaesserella parasuis]MDO9667653.1 pyridoxamine 5'-phosphate oxidase family protein [Glaesserella parasui
MQKRIFNFIQKKYLCTISCARNNIPWSNAFYYVFDEDNLRLIFVTSLTTYHSQVMLENPNISGTIFVPTRFHPSLQGVQFTGKARKLEGDEKILLENYIKKNIHMNLLINCLFGKQN